MFTFVGNCYDNRLRQNEYMRTARVFIKAAVVSGVSKSGSSHVFRLLQQVLTETINQYRKSTGKTRKGPKKLSVLVLVLVHLIGLKVGIIIREHKNRPFCAPSRPMSHLSIVLTTHHFHSINNAHWF